jgi:hypothetical protein
VEAAVNQVAALPQAEPALVALQVAVVDILVLKKQVVVVVEQPLMVQMLALVGAATVELALLLQIFTLQELYILVVVAVVAPLQLIQDGMEQVE